MWKVIASASAAVALTIAVVTSVRDDRPRSSVRDDADAGAEPQEPSRVESAAAGAPRPAATSSTNTATVGEPSDTSAGAENGASASASATSMTTTSSASFDTADAGGDAAPARLPAVPVVAAPPATATPVAMPSDAGASTDARTTGSDEESTREASAPDAGDGGAAQAPDPWAPPSMSAGAGPFTTQAPYWGASAFVSNPNAGAGRFTTEAPPWAASAFTSNPNAGAGPFTTEWNIPAYGFWPYWPWGPSVPAR